MNISELLLYGDIFGGSGGDFEAGRKAEWDRFWDSIQNFGARTDYNYAFYQWGAEYIRPKYKTTNLVNTSLSSTFNRAVNLKRVEKEYFDFSSKPVGTGAVSSCYYTFYNCANLEVIEDIGIPAEYSYTYTFAHCSSLKTIEVLRSHNNTLYDNTFSNCAALSDLVIEGTIGKNGFSVRWSTQLTHDSLMSIINALEDKTGTSGTWTITLGEANLAKLSEEEIGIAEAKGWVLA